MKHSIWIITLLAVASFWGCNRDNENNNGNVGVLGGVNGQCLAGQVLTQAGQCLNQFGCPAGTGYDGNSCVQGQVVTPNQFFTGGTSSYASSLTVTNRQGFENFLGRVGGVCDIPGFFTFTFFGDDPYDCDTYSRAGFITVDVFPNNTNPLQLGNGHVPAYVTIGAGSNSPQSGFFNGLYGGDFYSTVPLTMQVFPINNGAGFELQIVNEFFGLGTASLFSIRAESGNFFTDQNIAVTLYQNGQEFARTTLVQQPFSNFNQQQNFQFGGFQQPGFF